MPTNGRCIGNNNVASGRLLAHWQFPVPQCVAQPHDARLRRNHTNVRWGVLLQEAPNKAAEHVL
jgi:hypothetical protein